MENSCWQWIGQAGNATVAFSEHEPWMQANQTSQIKSKSAATNQN
ncbi:hypothetical protein [Novipirellula aureliae]|nr:hypothetical protein [Novipirellula aureliae]